MFRGTTQAAAERRFGEYAGQAEDEAGDFVGVIEPTPSEPAVVVERAFVGALRNRLSAEQAARLDTQLALAGAGATHEPAGALLDGFLGALQRPTPSGQAS